MNAAERIAQLIEQIEHHNHLYYSLAKPTLPDTEFDALLRELEALEAAHPELLRPDSPSQRVGGSITKSFATVKHIRPMQSLANTYSMGEVGEWEQRLHKQLVDQGARYLMQLKVDGVALSLHYENGQLVRAITRGDGTQGDDITANARTIRSIPLAIRKGGLPPTFEVRGEVYMTRTVFNQLNAERAELGEDPLMNPRNTTAGTLKQQASADVAKRKLSFVAYYLASDAPLPPTDSDCLALLAEAGFPVSKYNKLAGSLEEIEAYIEHWKTESQKLDFDIDGIVLKVDQLALRDELGSTAKSPRWAIAYKYEAERASTRLLSVDFQVGRTGYITPVANLQPVLLAGTTVKRASLYNYDEIARLDLHLNDTVLVEKSGEIIPKVLQVDASQRGADAQPIVLPNHCPACGSALVQNEGEVGHYCPNAEGCPPQIKGRIEHFASRKALNIDGLGTELAAQLVDVGLVHSIADLYDLKKETLQEKLERFGEKSADNLLLGLERSKQVPFARVLYGLGIRYVGEGVAEKLVQHFGSLAALQAATQAEVGSVYNIGDRIAQSIAHYFAEPRNVEVVQRLQSAGLQLVNTQTAKLSNALEGKKILISGVFEGHSRDELKAMILAHGGIAATGVSGALDYLLAGENMGPAKLQKAEKLGIHIIGIDEFLAMIA